MKTNIVKNFLYVAVVGIFACGCTEGDKFDYEKNVVFITGTEVSPVIKFVVEDTPASYAVTASVAKKVDKDVKIEFAVDNSLVEAYNKANNTSYYEVPEGTITIENTDAVIEAGTAYSSAATVKVISTENLQDGRAYVIPVTMKSVDGMDVLQPSKTVYLRIARVFNFASLNLSNTNAYSNYIFSDEKMQTLSNFTYEIKCFVNAWHTSTSEPISRMCQFTSKSESRSSMLRFGENGQDVNSLQWVNPSGGLISTTRFSTERWYTISLTYDGSRFTMYVDGVKDVDGEADGDPVEFQRLELGMSWGGGYPAKQYFNGRVAEIRVWNRALSPAEIQLGLCGVDTQAEGLVAYWKLNEGEGHIFNDATGHGYDIDWSKTVRDMSENGVLVDTPSAADALSWDNDEKNKCAQ